MLDDVLVGGNAGRKVQSEFNVRRQRKTESQSNKEGRSLAKAANAPLATAVAQARKQAALTQLELARAAGVSPKTIVQVEGAGVARSDAIIRLAVALGQSPEKWLDVAGMKIPMQRIREVIEERGPQRARPPFARIDPIGYFRQMIQRLHVHKAALMCSCVTSHIPINSEDLFKITGELYENGFHLALVCPFPAAATDLLFSKPRLSNYYNQCYTWARDLADLLQKHFPLARGRTHVFLPAQTTVGMLVHPPIRASDLRPAMTKFAEVPASDGKGTIPARYELGSYIKYSDGKPDSWIDIYRGEDPMSERVTEAYGVWYDYFSEILENWQFDETGSKFDESKLSFWRLAPAR